MNDSLTPSKRLVPRWLWVTATVLLLPALAALLIYAIRGDMAERRLGELLAEYARRGEPVTIADLQPTSVPDTDNAAIDLLGADRLLEQAPDQSRGAGQVELSLPWTAEELVKVRAMLAGSSAAFQRVRAATTKNGVDWGIQLKSPLLLVLLPPLAPMRRLANCLAAAALEAHVRGDDSGAIGHVENLLFVSRAVDRMPGGIIAHLVALGVQAEACNVVRQIAPDLSVGEAGGRIARNRVQSLIGVLLDDAPLRQGQQRSLLLERVQIVDSFQNMLAGAFQNTGVMVPDEITSIKRFFARPKLLNEARLGAEYLTAAAVTAQANDLPAALANPNNLASDLKKHPDRYSSTALVLIPSYNRAIEVDFRVRTESRAAAIALAMRLYAIEHDGKLPSCLEDLVPAFLPAVPGDPMGAGSPPLHYIADEKDPRIYSVGNNSKDDGGSELPKNARRAADGPSNPWECLDAVFHYFRQPRATTQPAE